MSTVPDDWYADEEFWKTTYPFMFPDARFAAADGEVADILALVQRDVHDVLDLACGPGRHAIPLARRGYAVTGVDRSEFLLAHARSRAVESGVTLELLQADMRDFRRPRSFDLALSLFTSFGFFRDDGDNQRVLDNVAASLRPGGAFVLDTLGKEILARIFDPTSSHEIPNGVVVSRRRVLDGWSRIENDWIIIEGGRARTFQFSHWLYSGRELTRMFEQAGFDDVRVYADFSGAPYDTEAKRLVVVGRMAG